MPALHAIFGHGVGKPVLSVINADLMHAAPQARPVLQTITSEQQLSREDLCTAWQIFHPTPHYKALVVAIHLTSELACAGVRIQGAHVQHISRRGSQHCMQDPAGSGWLCLAPAFRGACEPASLLSQQANQQGTAFWAAASSNLQPSGHGISIASLISNASS